MLLVFSIVVGIERERTTCLSCQVCNTVAQPLRCKSVASLVGGFHIFHSQQRRCDKM